MKVFPPAILFFIMFTPHLFAGNSSDNDSTGKIRFRTVDVSVESEHNALAAYQIDIRYDKEKIKIVGLEGGSGGFSEPPYYDRAGLDGGRIIIASFVDNDLKAEKGKTKVARLHIQTTGYPPFILTTEPMVAAKPGGDTIPIKVGIAYGGEQSPNDRE